VYSECLLSHCIASNFKRIGIAMAASDNRALQSACRYNPGGHSATPGGHNVIRDTQRHTLLSVMTCAGST
jgi:hypothetical protein